MVFKAQEKMCAKKCDAKDQFQKVNEFVPVGASTFFKVVNWSWSKN